MAPVLLFQALIVDAAVETFWRGSPVRWIVVSIAAASVIAGAWLWRRSSHHAKLAIATFAFFAMLAITAWQPAGLDEGVRLLGLSTSSVLSLAVACGIGVGATVIGLEARLPRPLRWFAAVLGAYGVIAFAQGILGAVPFHALFTGASFWRPLPTFLQGSFVGGLLVVAFAFIVVTVRGGVRPPREGTRLRALHQLIALAAALSLVIAALPSRATPGSAGGGAAGSPATNTDVAARVALLDNSLHAIEDGDRESPRDRWDPDYVVQQLGRDPQRLFEWVRDNTFWIPYRGILRGPVGVLMDRQGNSLDRALLLATLLEKAGQTVRLAHGELTRDQTDALLPALMTRRALAAGTLRVDVSPVSDDQASIQAVAAQYSLSPADIERSLDARGKAVSTLYSELRTRMTQQSQRLVAAVGKPSVVADLRKRFEAAVEACRDHWWVQRQDGDAWHDVDLLGQDAGKTALTTPTRTSSLAGVDTSLHHDLVVRVIAEHAAAGVLKEDSILEHTVTPSDLIGDILVLQFWPSAWPTELAADPNSRFGFRSAALEQTDWTVLLLSKENVLARGTVAASGAGQPVSGNPFGGLVRGIAEGSNRGSASGPQLTAIWIEYQFHAPGSPARTVRRVVFDLLGPSRRAAGAPSQLHLDDNARLTRSLSLMMRTEMLPLAAELAPEFAVHVSAQSVLGHRGLLRAVAGPDEALDGPKVEELLDNTAPGISALLPIAIGRFVSASPSVFVDRLNLLTRHQFPTLLSDGLHFVDAIDIVSNEMGVDPTEVDGFAARVAQGVLDTNVEALLHATPWPASNTAEAFKTSGDWVTLLPSNPAEIEKLQVSADLRRSISADLDSGHAVVVPRSPHSANALDVVGWWRIDTVTGDTLGVGADGWGQDLAEDLVQHVIWRHIRNFAFQYAFCQAIPQVAANVVFFLQQYRDQLPKWLPPLAQSKDPVTVLKESHRGCLIGAMIGTGVTAALPFLIATLRFSGRGLMAMASRGASAAESGANPSAKTLPAVNPLAKTEAGVNPLASTEPGVNPSPMGPPRGSPPPGEGSPLGPPRGSPPPGEGSPPSPPRGSPPPGPFQGDPELRDYLENNPDHPLTKALGGRSGDAAALYRQADAAATSAFNAAREAGLSNEAAYQASYEAYFNYLRQGRGAYYRLLANGKPLKVAGPGTFKAEVGAAGFGGPGVK